MLADLSFNNIEVIEGLDKLVSLEDLTLYNNRISLIENMDSLTRLHVLSLGNNDLSKLDNVSYFNMTLFLVIHHAVTVKKAFHSGTILEKI